MLNNSAQIYQIMKSINTNKYKRSVKYNKIPLKLLHNKGDYHMFKGLKHQLELTDNLPYDILSKDNELIKLKMVLNWKAIRAETGIRHT